LDNSQIESTVNEIRKCSGAVTAFNKDKISLNQKGEDMQNVWRRIAYLQQNQVNGVVYVS